MREFCTTRCSDYPLVNHANSKTLTVLLNALREKFGNEVCDITNKICPNMTVCYNCRIDDFCHLSGGCELDKESKKVLDV